MKFFKLLLSSNQKLAKKPVSRLSAVRLRTGATCISCINLVGSSGKLKCRVSTFECEKYVVSQMATIEPYYANYCKDYEAEDIGITFTPIQYKRPEHSISKFSKPDNVKIKKLETIIPDKYEGGRKMTYEVNIKELATIISELDQDYSEFEETRIINKKISYPNTDKSLEALKNAVFKFIENGYSIHSVDMVKCSELLKQKGKETIEESVSLFIKK